MASFLGEIKRRKVVQVAAVYAVVAWLLIQIVATVEQPLNLPAWFDTVVIVLLALGFPVALILSWAFNLTADGLVRESPPAIAPEPSGGAQDTTETGAEEVDGGTGDRHEKPSIAVLPFQTMADDPDKDYVADGVVESITAGLSCIRSFFVIARNSAFTFKNRTVNAIEIGKELGIAYLLEGSIQIHGDRIRITVQLIETAAGAHLWAKRYDGTIDDLFDLQDHITEMVAGALQPSIRLAEIERAIRKRPQDQGAYDLTMRAMRHVWGLERAESEKALGLLNQALSIEPSYPLALSLAGWCHAQQAVYNWSDDIGASHAEAQTLAERAVELSGDDPLILTVLGAVYTIVRNYGTARALLERAVTLDSNSAWAWQRLGWLETYTGQPEQALEHFERALRLSPVDPMNFNVHAGMGSAHEAAERYDEAAAEYRSALEERPHAHWIYRHLASALVGAGQIDEAKQAFDKLMSSYPELTASKVRDAVLYPGPMVDRIVSHLKALGMPD